MIAEIGELAYGTRAETGLERFSEPVMHAMAHVPRHHFVARGDEGHAYDNRPRPIGAGQTISQPYIVALMTELLGVKPGDRVLEIGTGSGYQAAVLAHIGVDVYSIEIVESLAREARCRLDEAGYGQVHIRVGDGAEGWPEAAPFDAIIITAAGRELPHQLARQLKAGGRLVMPVRHAAGMQILTLMTKSADGEMVRRNILGVRFVPLTGSYG